MITDRLRRLVGLGNGHHEHGSHAYDVVVVGAGTAGMPCAITAAEGGARVAVVEKSDEIGGTLHLSTGQMSAAGSRLQRSKGIEDSPDLHFEEVMRRGHGKNNPELVRMAVDEAGASIDWLEQLGVEFPEDQPVIYHGHDPYDRPRTYWGTEMGYSVLNAMKPPFERLVEEGKIDLLLGHAMTDLIVEDGRVVGVKVEGHGHDDEIRGNAIVLASGGYASSAELLAEMHPGVHCLTGGRTTSTGDGLRAARSLGAGVRGGDCHLPTHGGIEWPPGSGNVDIYEAMGNVNANYRTPREIHVNAAGERFLREDSKSPDERERALMAQDGVFWIVLDEAAIDEDDPIVMGWSADMLRQHAAAGENAWVADDVRELARKAGIDPEGLARTVDAWNEGVRAGSDPLGREEPGPALARPPYYAIRSDAFTVISFAGVTVDTELRVTREDGTPIEGLYAIGEMLGASTMMGDGYCGGMAVTPALSLGRILGRRFADAASRLWRQPQVASN